MTEDTLEQHAHKEKIVTFIYALRSLLFYIGYSLSMITYSSLAVIVSLFLSRQTSAMLCAYWCQFSLWWARVTCGIRYRVIGAENIPEGGCIILAKHQSAWETLFAQAQFHPVATVLKRELLWIPFFGWGLRFSDPIAINRADRSNALKSLLRQGEERLRDGRRIIIFPEGTRTLPGAIKPEYSVGGAMLACRNKALVVPLAHNAGDCWPRGTMIKRPGLITVVIGKPINAGDYSAKTLNAEVSAWIEARMPEISAAYKTDKAEK